MTPEADVEPTPGSGEAVDSNARSDAEDIGLGVEQRTAAMRDPALRRNGGRLDAAGLLPRRFEPVAFAQAAYYAGTGVWSLVGIRSFQKVTGPKEDVWLVKTVGSLVAVLGGALAYAAVKRSPSRELVLAAAGSAAALGVVSTVYPLRGRISKTYLLDAVAEAGLLGAWASVMRNDPRFASSS